MLKVNGWKMKQEFKEKVFPEQKRFFGWLKQQLIGRYYNPKLRSTAITTTTTTKCSNSEN